ncbi:hypothetical protein C8R34_10737 [Nitrosomonas sp. Nm84]|uniref:DUF1566 domain-containing protein n=1 Tax=Nitrosomonas sp. Nm84 TaxID=200124 RepID=UPI000D75EE44|nr:DUF1566 domain-containing protein [Nitrosomonas sp. Nm84]PXW88354.1 hypothetical protein C8R34_10737 [Nitrosomonas sp. Nm84]
MKQNLSKQPLTILYILLFSIAIMLSGNVLAVGEKATVEQLNAVVTNQATIDAGQNAAIATVDSKISGITPPVRAIGDVLPDGSIVFWVDETGQHGMAAKSFDGPASNWYDAKEVAENNGPGWRLPTKHELFILFDQRVVVGGMDGITYWSSTEADAIFAWSILFNPPTSTPATVLKTHVQSVRAIRHF